MAPNGAVLSAPLICGAAFAQDGARSFAQRCAGCHGADGAGGERAPEIVYAARFTAQSADDLRRVIERGVPDAGMPGFALPAAEMKALVAHIETLRAPGDAASGERVFQSRCVSCHRGTQLSGTSLSHRNVRRVDLTLRDGTKITGYVKSESNFDVQLRRPDGTLRLLDAREIRSRSAGQPVALKLDATERRDLMAYLSRVEKRATPKAVTAAGRNKRGDWPTYHGQLGGNRHSALDQVNTRNVHQLAPVWMFPVPNTRRLEVTPLVVDGIMYVTAGNQATTYTNFSSSVR